MNKKSELIDNIIKQTTPKRKIKNNLLKSFIVGGTICLIAQIIKGLLILKFDEKTSQVLSTILMIFLGSLFTGVGLYDKIGQFSGAGTIIPITGFANSMTSSAMEAKSEGIVLGIINNMLKLAGSVIITGVISAFIFSSIYYLLGIYK